MKLMNGKFFEGETEIPLEFGNKEQIRLINEAEKRISELKEGLVLDVEYTKIKIIKAEVEFKCKCGQSVWGEVEEIDEDGIDEFIGMTCTCYRCKQKYILFKNDDGDLCTKLKI